MKKIFTLSFLALSLQITAQIFTNYTTTDGLINNNVICLAVDHDDKLWFGTQEGLSLFDGSTWTNYDDNSHPELIHNTITALAVDNNNHLWIGTDFGINEFDGTNWTTYTEADGLVDNRIKYINQDGEGNMWFANNDGISIYDGTDWTNYTMADGLPFGGCNFVTFDNDGAAYLGTPLGGVWVLKNGSFSSIIEADGLLSNNVRSIAIDDYQHKWIGTADGISVFNSNDEFITHHEMIFELPPPDELNPVEDIQIAADGRIWVGVYVDYLVTEGGISFYDNTGWSDYNVDDGLVGPVVRRLAIDEQQNIWVATSTGVSKIGGVPTSAITIETESAIRTYPNPVQSTINISVPDEFIGQTYEIINRTGMLIDYGKVPNSQFELDLGVLSDGLYFLTIEGIYSKKIVVGR